MKNFSVILVLFLIVLLTFPAFADFPIYQGSTKDYGCDVAYNSTNNEYLVIWLESYSSQMKRLLAKRVNEYGQVGTVFTISDYAESLPSVVYNSQKNQYLVAFVTGIAPDLTIYGQLLTSTGAKIGGTVQLIGHAKNPTILYNSKAGNYLVIGEEKIPSWNSGFCYTHLYSRKIGADGQPLNATQTIYNSYPTYGTCTDAIEYSIAYAPVISSETPQGRYLVVYYGPSSNMMLDSDGKVMVTLTNPQSGATYPWIPFQQSKIGISEGWDVAFGYWEGEPVFLVVWADRDNNMTWQGVQWTGIWCGVVDAVKIDYLTTEGVSTETFPISKIWSHWAYSSYAETWNPVVEYNYVAKKFMVAWRETPGPDPQNDTQVNHIRGNSMGYDDFSNASVPDNVILSAISGNEDPYQPAIAVSSKKPNALVVWEDKRNFSSKDFDIYGNILETTGSYSLKITSPNGGESWLAGSTHNITWTSVNIPDNDVSLEYSTNNGASYNPIGYHTNNEPSESFSWEVANSPSTQCLVRVSVTMPGNTYVVDVSDAVFTITAPVQKITVTSPNGGENWLVGSSHNITWTNQNFTSPVKIEYSTNSGVNYSSIIGSTSNSGTYPWVVPNNPSTNCLVKISDVADGTPFDVSNVPFTISSPDNTQPGNNVNVDLGGGVDITFEKVDGLGNTTMTTSSTSPPPPNGFTIIPANSPVIYKINSTANYSGKIKICIKYDDTGMTLGQEKLLRLHVYNETSAQWDDITISLDTNANIICGEVNHLSDFAIMLPSSGPVVKFVPSVSHMRIGHPDTIDVVIDSVNDLGSFEFEIFYDGTIVQIAQLSDVILGDFLGSTGRSAIPVGPIIDNTAGSIVYGAASLGTQAGASGSGVLAKMIWTPQNEGKSTLDLKNVKVSNTQGTQIPVSEEDGEINVTSRFWADIDGDNDIDIIDVQLVAAHWNTQTGDANYDPIYDVDNNGEGDGDVDIIDVQLVASWWNKAIPPNSLLAIFNEQENDLGKMTDEQSVSLRIFPERTASSSKNYLIVQAENVTDLAGFQFDVFLKDASGLSPNITLGEFLKSSGNEVFGLGPNRTETGKKITVGGFSLGQNGGVSGSGILARVALQPGMDFANGLAFENFKLVNSHGQTLRISSVNNEFTNLQNLAQLPNSFTLSQNYPNPFNPETYISFELPEVQKAQTYVSLFVYNMQGQLVRQLINENKSPGAYTIKWDAKNGLGEKVPSGIYVYTLTAGDFKTSRKMLLLK